MRKWYTLATRLRPYSHVIPELRREAADRMQDYFATRLGLGLGATLGRVECLRFKSGTDGADPPIRAVARNTRGIRTAVTMTSGGQR
ncbi:MAG TPA: hypothetical protein VGU71_06650 [Candidatus Dormibacteraeota bacterium]|nr:hypothetical protein [Candidatus Dormibacteraeota bacterium]